MNAAFTQDNPGDAVDANADAAARVTLVPVYQRGVGDMNPPLLVASAASLPDALHHRAGGLRIHHDLWKRRRRARW